MSRLPSLWELIRPAYPHPLRVQTEIPKGISGFLNREQFVISCGPHVEVLDGPKLMGIAEKVHDCPDARACRSLD